MAASDTRKPQNQLIYDLIEESNPGFKATYPLGSLQFASATAITVDSSDTQKKDTQVICRGAPGSGIIGTVTVKYRRIDVGTLFRNVLPRLTGYAATGYVRASWIAEINSRFGLSVLDSDFDSGWQTMVSGTSYNIPILAASLCYKGTFTNISWVPGKRPMSTMITDANRSLVGRSFPSGGNDFTTPGRKPMGEWQTYGIDMSAMKDVFATIPSPWAAPVGQNTAASQQLLAWLNSNTGRTNWNSQDPSVEGSIYGLTWTTYSLPNSGAPDANSSRFNRVIVIQAIASSWFTGKLYFHFNV